MHARRRRVLVEGSVMALIGQGVVAASCSVANLLSGQPAFHTVELLGRALLSGRGPPGGPIAVLAYSGVHLALFLILGVGVATLIEATECHPRLWLPCVSLTVVGLLSALFLFLYATRSTLEGLSWWSVTAANAAAGVAMAAYACRRHRGLLRRITPPTG